MVMIIETYEIPRDRIASERRHPESPSLGRFSGFIAGVNMKKCAKCGEIKEFIEFDKNKTRKDGCGSWCKLCKRIRSKEYYRENKKQTAMRNKEYYRTHPELKSHMRNLYLNRIYGISVQEYNNMYIKQSGCCAICGMPQSEFRRRFAVDHCHATNTNRGLLCVKCNSAIGNFNDDIDAMASAISYLQQDYSRQAV